MRRKWWGVAGIISVLLLISVIRVYSINREAKVPEKKYFPMNECVEFGKDFYKSAEEMIDGYTIEVLDSEVLKMEDFCDKYQIEKRDSIEEKNCYYLVRAKVTNHTNQTNGEHGVSIANLTLAGKNYIVIADLEMYTTLNTDMPDEIGFALAPGDSKEILIPYEIYPENITGNEERIVEIMEENPPFLKITEYPTQKLIQTRR